MNSVMISKVLGELFNLIKSDKEMKLCNWSFLMTNEANFKGFQKDSFYSALMMPFLPFDFTEKNK